MKPGRLAPLGVLVCVLGVGFAAATSLAVGTRSLGAGGSAVSSCAGLGAASRRYTTSGGAITAVTLSGLPAACNGGQARVALTQGVGSVGAGGPVAVAAGSVTVPVSPQPAVGAVTNLYVSVSGP